MFEYKDIAIVILNWNGKALLEEFLPTVLRHSEDAIVYVVDNASTDDSVDFIKATYPTVHCIEHAVNYGYARGYNEALKYISQPIYCLLNSDVEVTAKWLQPVLKAYNTDAQTAIIQPKLLDYKRPSHFEYAGAAGGFIDRYGYPFCRGRIFNTIERDTAQYNDVSSIFWASGACFFIKREVFEGLKGFDDYFFAHMEEIDLCWRAFNKGYTCTYVGTSEVFHVGGATLKNSSPKKTYLNFRNSLITLVKNTDKNVFGRTFTRLILDGIAALRFLYLGQPHHILAILHAHLSFYKRLPKVLKQRQLLQHTKGYAKTRSIVWVYFIKKQQTFNCL